jgi:hypothetical protein
LTFINLPSVGSLTLDINNYLTRSSLAKGDASKFALSHMLYGKIVRSARRSGFSRRKARKIANRRRRNFVDNIIMHHKRIHDHNRNIVVNNARERALLKKKQLENKANINLSRIEKNKNQYRNWRERPTIKSQSLEIRSRINSRKVRAQSRWASLIEQTST